MSFYKAKQPFAEIRQQQIAAHSSPIDWDVALGHQEICAALESKLSGLGRKVDALSREVSYLQAAVRRK